jgi:hypothetical protein
MANETIRQYVRRIPYGTEMVDEKELVPEINKAINEINIALHKITKHIIDFEARITALEP